jgi:DNA primase
MKASIYNFYDKIRSNIRVSDVVKTKVNLIRKGQEFLGICPFHSEKTPSFTVNDRKRFFHCFGCGAHGDIINFESEVSGLSYKDASFKIAQKFGIDLPTFSKEEEIQYKKSEKIALISKLASEFYASNINSSVLKILEKRGISADVIKEYNIGYSGERGDLLKFFSNKSFAANELLDSGLVKKISGNMVEFFSGRIMIPIVSNFGKVIGFGARSLGDELPKYINSSETLIFKKSESLFGEDVATAASYKSGYFILVEGYFDVIKLASSGFKEAVASLGTSVTKSHLFKLWQTAPEIIVCLDGDAAGIRAANRVIDLSMEIISSEKILSFINLPKGMDPDDIINKKGHEYFKNLIDNRISLSYQIFLITTAGKKIETAEQKAHIERELENFANRIKDELLKKNFQKFFKDKCWQLFNKKQARPKTDLTLKVSLEKDDSINAVLIGITLNYLDFFDPRKIDEVLTQISSSDSKFSDFSSHVQQILHEYEDIDSENIIKLIKKTSFYLEFEIISAEYNNSVSSDFDKIKATNVLEYFLSLKYMSQLNDELANILQTKDENLEKKYSFYLKEIARTKEKINNLTISIYQ